MVESRGIRRRKEEEREDEEEVKGRETR